MQRWAYYNEFDPFAAEWLRELIRRRLIADGEVDTRSIVDVRAADLRGFRQHHFFAGIGGWSYALLLAQWPDETPVWTGSCPCQPFSSAGSRKAAADDRDLWPHLFRLARECRPVVVFGEQVDSPLGRLWLSRVHAEMESIQYRVGAASLAACSVEAPHARPRLYWVSDAHPAEGIARDEGGATRQGAAAGGYSPDGGPLVYTVSDAGGAGRKGHQRDHLPGAWRRKKRGAVAELRPPLPWDEYEVRIGRGDRAYRIEPGLEPMAAGLSEVLGRLRDIEISGLREVSLYANSTGSNPSEVMRMVRKAVCAKESGKNNTLECKANFMRRKFCSRSCSVSKQHTREALTVAASRKRASREFMLERCDSCGSAVSLSVHHIDGNPMNNTPSNMQTLCLSCHSFWHAYLKRIGVPPSKPMPRLIAWDACAGTGTRSSRKSRRSSSPHILREGEEGLC